MVLTLTACAVLTGATSLLAVGEWIADAPAQVLERLGIRIDPLMPTRPVPVESTVRRLLARIDADALDQAVGRWLANRRPEPSNPADLPADLAPPVAGLSRGRSPQPSGLLNSWRISCRAWLAC
jgi:hypothetical protein